MHMELILTQNIQMALTAMVKNLTVQIHKIAYMEPIAVDSNMSRIKV